MQTFSNMRRSSVNQNYLKLFWISLVLTLGQVMSSLYPPIPTFVGVIFCYLVLEFDRREEQPAAIILSFLYLCLYDITKGFYLFSYVILFVMVYRFAIFKIQTLITCNNCILASYVILAYLGHYLLNLFLAYINNEAFPYFSNFYFYYIAIDSIVSFMLFRVSR